MKQVGVRHTVMLTGDRKEAAETVAQTLGIDEVHAELLPGGKVEQVEALLKAEKKKSVLHLLEMESMMLRYSPERTSESQWEAWVPMRRSKQRILS